MLTEEHPTRRFLPQFERKEPLIKDHSVTKLWKDCPRKYFYRTVLGFKAPKEELRTIFDWGTAIHMLMEKLYESEGDFQLAFTAALKIYSAPPRESKWKHLDISRFSQTCKLLFEFYQKDVANPLNEVVNVEAPFNIALPDGTQIGGRFDMLRTNNGRLIVRDWKTTTKQASWFIPSLNPNDQATRYVYAASRLSGWTNDNPKGKVDGIEFVLVENQSPTKSDQKPPKIATALISKSHHELIEWEEDQMFIYKQMALSRQLDMWPKHENNCTWCDFKTACRQQTDGAIAWELKTNFIVDFWDHTREDKTE